MNVLRGCSSRIYLAIVIFLLSSSGFAQIVSGFGFSCRDMEVDGLAMCSAGAVCSPGNVSEVLAVSVFVDVRCPNNPVVNEAQTDAAVLGTQLSGTSKATTVFYGRLHSRHTEVSDCYRSTTMTSDFIDPQACYPPPPVPRGGGGCNSDEFIAGCNFDPNSPIIIDMAADGIQLTSAANGVPFDLRGDGTLLHLAWTAPGSDAGFLALDRNGNGRIEDGRELFGNYTLQDPSGAPNGFLALARYDLSENGGNGDGTIDQSDNVFSTLRFWRDSNHDGVSQPDELLPLQRVGIQSVSLEFKMSARRDRFGNMFRYRSTVKVLNPNGATIDRNAYDVFLGTE
ncbi:MAG: hypothetical protein HYX28_06355 [Candidatus Koribacter versatilis]|uniref:Uncharacterized protein n=1 Tax=Candidatus Korobacter versatilis TaxID=658062 RepID=A0A932AA11_9BACT|nr:hypothetical protein [Candidatus Koribacter versatilis]